MLESTMRELMDAAGVNNITIRTDNEGLLGTGRFAGTERQVRNRLGSDLDLRILETEEDELIVVRCRPPS